MHKGGPLRQCSELLMYSCSVSRTTAAVVSRHGVWCAGVTVTTVSSRTMNAPRLGLPQPDSALADLVSLPLLGEPLIGPQ